MVDVMILDSAGEHEAVHVRDMGEGILILEQYPFEMEASGQPPIRLCITEDGLKRLAACF